MATQTPAASDQDPNVSFSFGKNWEQFIQQHFSEERIDIAGKHLLNFLGVSDLKGRTFTDVGCGSGIHSLAAFRAGAERILSFDLDPHSVSTTLKMREWAGNPQHWTVQHGSALDKDMLARLPKADIVYSWGVLHHTGKMWEAVENVASLIAPGGVYYLALYNTHSMSNYWLKKKIKYNAASALGKRFMEASMVTVTSAYALLRFRNPFKEMLTYKKRRGMSYMTDIRDWLGGYPYEHASQGETVRFAVNRLKLQVVNMESGQGASAITEYLLKKT